jgi:hypothetical protein
MRKDGADHDLKGREAVLELQLSEACNLNASRLVKKVEKKRSEVSTLKEKAETLLSKNLAIFKSKTQGQ